MKMNKISALLLAGTFGFAHAALADVAGGNGIGHTLQFTPTQFDSTLSVKTGDVLNGNPGDATAYTLGAVASMAWNDPATNPIGGTEGYGWSHNSRWALIDLNKLNEPVSGESYDKARVIITVERYDDGIVDEVNSKGQPLPSDDDLIPGLTVWKGAQRDGNFIYWYPNMCQQEPSFWAVNLSKCSYNSGYDNQDQTVARVERVVKLDEKKPANNMLTVSYGGDMRDAATKHSANYKISVEVQGVD